MAVCQLLYSTFYLPLKTKKLNNKEFLTKAWTEVFINRDADAIDKYYAPEYKQNGPTLKNSFDEFKVFVRSLGPDFKFEFNIIGEMTGGKTGDVLVAHTRYSGWTDKPLTGADIIKINDGRFVEHWDVLEEDGPDNEW